MIDIPRDTLTQAAEGNLGAFEQVYNAASGFVYTIALRITNNKSDAEEVTQDVFMQIFKNLKNFKFESSFKTWIYRIAVNTAINKYKRTSQERRRLTYEDISDIQGNIDRTAEFINAESAQVKAATLLSLLNPEQRACILLREMEGLSYKEIAGALKININTVRSRLKRARQALMASASRGKIPREL